MQRDTSSTSSDSVAYKEIPTFKEAYSLDLAMLNYLISIKRHDLDLNPEELIEISEEGGE